MTISGNGDFPEFKYLQCSNRTQFCLTDSGQKAAPLGKATSKCRVLVPEEEVRDGGQDQGVRGRVQPGSSSSSRSSLFKFPAFLEIVMVVDHTSHNVRQI